MGTRFDDMLWTIVHTQDDNGNFEIEDYIISKADLLLAFKQFYLDYMIKEGRYGIIDMIKELKLWN